MGIIIRPDDIPPEASTTDVEFRACRDDLEFFIEKTFKIINPGVSFLSNWHIGAYAEYLMACYNRQIKRLIINVPPRYLKSISCSVAFPAWALGKNPSLKFMAASYSKDLAFKHSVDCRTLMKNEWYGQCFPLTQLKDDQDEKKKFMTTMGGHRIATSVGATATGEGGNFLIMDDPHNAMQAQSDTIRESQINWFYQTFTTRLNDKKNDVIIVVMQRLHPMDLTGVLMDDGGWEQLVLPASTKKPLMIQLNGFKHEMKPGDLLHNDREDKKTLEQVKKNLRSYGYSAQYLQEPTIESGGIFEKSWFKLWPAKAPLPEFEFVIQSWDTAFTERTDGDPSAKTVWGVFRRSDEHPWCAMLLDAESDYLSYPKLRRKVAREYFDYLYGAKDRKADIVLIEEKGSGISLIQDLEKTTIPIAKYNPGKADKVQRAHAISHIIEAGRIYIPESSNVRREVAGWAEDFMKQCCGFPKAAHDDYVDTMTQALKYMIDSTFLSLEPEEDEPEVPIKEGNPYAK